MLDFQKEFKVRKSVGGRLAAWRKKAGLGQTELAERIGIGQAALSRIESGNLPLHVIQLKELARLGVDLHYLIVGESFENKDHNKEVTRLIKQIHELKTKNQKLKTTLEAKDERLLALIDKLTG